ncbi:lytic transglycosylase domain-containing protein [Altericroceibacterium endophyticum]|uniref:Transglycosylase SLT domain-containing protein n=1 Tax=Altericroceibacterium endophyticum TaxID=1808508 RepID=A0A6I4T6G6_9SPHN|nr:lytic transglycosylase domain-containing protein [Altericroceibacterium endophyticum]MXO66804.1 transglycosylase SLT domain-containing protein [Altericroceibacterium endophyticum]
MILFLQRFAVFSALAAFVAVPAYADVLEIGGEGARWINGPQARAQNSPVDGEMNALGLPREAMANLVAHQRDIPALYAAKVTELSARYDLSPALIEALVWQESRWRENARSPVGARGLAQLMPATARYLGVDPDDPAANLEGGARYLREQLNRFDGDLEKALAAYNAGPGRVIRAGGIPKIAETQAYVASIMGRLSNHSRSSD